MRYACALNPTLEGASSWALTMSHFLEQSTEGAGREVKTHDVIELVPQARPVSPTSEAT